MRRRESPHGSSLARGGRVSAFPPAYPSPLLRPSVAVVAAHRSGCRARACIRRARAGGTFIEQDVGIATQILAGERALLGELIAHEHCVVAVDDHPSMYDALGHGRIVAMDREVAADFAEGELRVVL